MYGLDRGQAVGANRCACRLARAQVDGDACSGVFIHHHIFAAHAIHRVVARARAKPVGGAAAGQAVVEPRGIDVLDVGHQIGAALAIAGDARGQVHRHAGGGA